MNEIKRIKLGALWESSDPGSFQKCYSGKLGDAWIEVRPNKYKSQNPKAPDYIIYISEPKRKDKPTEESPNQEPTDFFF